MNRILLTEIVLLSVLLQFLFVMLILISAKDNKKHFFLSLGSAMLLYAGALPISKYLLGVEFSNDPLFIFLSNPLFILCAYFTSTTGKIFESKLPMKLGYGIGLILIGSIALFFVKNSNYSVMLILLGLYTIIFILHFELKASKA